MSNNKIKYCMFFFVLVVFACTTKIKDKEIRDKKEDFSSFFYNFSKDSVFQKERIIFPLKYSYEDIDSGLINELLDNNKWFYIDFNKDKSAKNNNVDAFEVIVKKISENKIKYIRKGIDNGILVEFYFIKINDKWFLVSVNDFST